MKDFSDSNLLGKDIQKIPFMKRKNVCSMDAGTSLGFYENYSLDLTDFK